MELLKRNTLIATKIKGKKSKEINERKGVG